LANETDDLGGPKEGEKAAERRVLQRLEVADRMRRRGLVKARDIATERRKRIWISDPGSTMLTPEVEGIADGSRGVICHTMGSVTCYAQPGPDALNLYVCANCNVDRAGAAAREAQLIDFRQRVAWLKKWEALKGRNPATVKQEWV